MSALKITLPDKSERAYDSGVTPQKIAADIGKRLEKDAIAAVVNGVEWDLTRPITEDATVAIITRASKEGLEIIRHSTAHLLAHAIKELYPDAQITIGPVIEDGFYYDIDCPKQLTPDDLPVIEKKMTEIAARNLEVSREIKEKKDAIPFFLNQGEKFKAEIIEGIPDEKVGLYTQGNFTDLCRGPHVSNTSRLGKFKLLSVAGAYWRGDEKNPMLQRIYGTAWATQKELDEYLHRIEEAKKRDHRKLGPELGLFTFLKVAPSMPFYLPKGAMLYNLLLDYIRKATLESGYEEVICPQIMTTELWATSGHLDNYKENMFFIEGEGESTMALKPMNCPGHVTLFGSTLRSYRDLPIRYMEFSKLHRNELAGVTHGLMRTRAFAQDDGHVFCAEDQLEAEVLHLTQLTLKVYKQFGFETIDVKLATRPEKFLGTVENWENATNALHKSLTRTGLKFEIAEGEGAFYGPKVEFHIRDSLGRYWQCGTIQLDYNLPERFGIEYIDSDNKPRRPIMIHRAVLGSLERFMGIFIEHHGGRLPLWTAPVQAKVINVARDQEAYATEITEILQNWGMRAEADIRNEKLGYKIREAQTQKVPLMLILGAREMESRSISVRKPDGENINDLSIEAFQKMFGPQLKAQEE